MIKLGLTGGMGSGKSTVAAVLAVLGIPVYIADEASKQLLASSLSLRSQLIQHFGNQVYPQGKLDKAYFSQLLFSSPERLAQANAIIHPAVLDDFLAWTTRCTDPIVAIESAILFEAGFDKHVHRVISVTAPLELRIQRVLDRDKYLSREEVVQRINNQWAQEKKDQLSHYLIHNNGTQALLPQLLQLLQELKNTSI